MDQDRVLKIHSTGNRFNFKFCCTFVRIRSVVVEVEGRKNRTGAATRLYYTLDSFQTARVLILNFFAFSLRPSFLSCLCVNDLSQHYLLKNDMGLSLYRFFVYNSFKSESRKLKVYKMRLGVIARTLAAMAAAPRSVDARSRFSLKRKG